MLKKKPLRLAFILIQTLLEGVSAIMRGLNEAQLSLQIVSPERQSNLSNYRKQLLKKQRHESLCLLKT